MGTQIANSTPTPPPPPPPGGDPNKKKINDPIVEVQDKNETAKNENKPNKPKSKKVSFIFYFDIGQILGIS